MKKAVKIFPPFFTILTLSAEKKSPVQLFFMNRASVYQCNSGCVAQRVVYNFRQQSFSIYFWH
jgi:hypothetical protein